VITGHPGHKAGVLVVLLAGGESLAGGRTWGGKGDMGVEERLEVGVGKRVRLSLVEVVLGKHVGCVGWGEMEGV